MWHDRQTTVTVGSKRKARLDVVGREVGEIIEHFGNGHAATEVVENVGDRDPRPANTGLPAANARINGDSFPVVHAASVPLAEVESSDAPTEHRGA